MKKMFFTAIAVIAFSGVSMANTIEEKQDETLKTVDNPSKNEKDSSLLVFTCEESAWAVAEIYNDDSVAQTGKPLTQHAYNVIYNSQLTYCNRKRTLSAN